MKHKNLDTKDTIIVSMVKLLKGDVDKIKYRKGFNNKDINSDSGTDRVYTTIFFKLMELIAMDVIEGSIVYLNRKAGAKFYVDYRTVSKELIEGKNDYKINGRFPKVDLRKTNYRMPFIAFDPGGVKSTPCICLVPKYLYAMLIEKVNAGKTYPKGTKEFWFNKK